MREAGLHLIQILIQLQCKPAELPAKIHSTEPLPGFPLRRAGEKVKHKAAGVTTSLTRVRSHVSTRVRRPCGPRPAWSSVLLWPSDRWRLCILGRGVESPDSSPGRGSARQKQTELVRGSRGRSETKINKQTIIRRRKSKQAGDTRAALAAPSQEARIRLRANPGPLPRKLIG
ncbi:unnamed protein product [Pleuronectes platessa]|uniref:Uncharacterized protein n=1 Tax=Pleuronectes platessa TaxID=8262 RepID=A0A9N7VV05_PLEPL|nr:unnamed protein product [Pleuronectes platessa]